MQSPSEPARVRRVPTARVWITVARLLLLCLSVSTLARGQANEIAVAPSTPSIKLAPGESAEILLTITNHSAQPIQALQLEQITTTKATIRFDPMAVRLVRPAESAGWKVSVQRTGEERIGGTLQFQLSYSWHPRAASSVVQGVSVVSIELQERDPDPLDKIASVRVETSLDLLRERRDVPLFLVVTNLSGRPLSISSMTVEKPSFITIATRAHDDPEPYVSAGASGYEIGPDGSVPLPAPSTTLPPLEARTFRFFARAKDAFPSGKHLLLFKVDVRQRGYGQEWTGTLVATHPFGIGVLGESELLTALGVPSFLLLPGFLILVVLKFAWQRVAPRKQIELDPKGTEFWMLAAFLSIIATLVYPIVTGWWGVSRNYLDGYGLRDVMNVWFGAMFVGLLFWGLGVIVRTFTAWIRESYIPSEEDEPLVVLLKLARNRMPLLCRQVGVKVTAEETLVFDIHPRLFKRVLGERCVAPTILVHWRRPTSPAETVQLDQLRGKLDVLRDQGTPRDVAEFLVQAQNSGLLNSVTWEQTGPVKRPAAIKKELVTLQAAVLRIVREA